MFTQVFFFLYILRGRSIGRNGNGTDVLTCVKKTITCARYRLSPFSIHFEIYWYRAIGIYKSVFKNNNLYAKPWPKWAMVAKISCLKDKVNFIKHQTFKMYNNLIDIFKFHTWNLDKNEQFSFKQNVVIVQSSLLSHLYHKYH